MGNGHETLDLDGNLDIQTALEIARNADTEVDPVVTDYLDSAANDVWARLSAQPDSYLLNKDEFALFNYYRRTFEQKDAVITQNAVARFWHNHGSTTTEA